MRRRVSGGQAERRESWDEVGGKHGLAPEDGGDIALDGAGGDAFEAHFCNEVAEALAEVFGLGGRERGGGVAGENDGAAAVAEVDPALGGKLAVGVGDGVEVDAELGGEGADAGEGVSCGEVAGGKVEADLINDLAVDGDGGVEGDGDGGSGHEEKCMAGVYRCQECTEVASGGAGGWERESRRAPAMAKTEMPVIPTVPPTRRETPAWRRRRFVYPRYRATP